METPVFNWRQDLPDKSASSLENAVFRVLSFHRKI